MPCYNPMSESCCGNCISSESLRDELNLLTERMCRALSFLEKNSKNSYYLLDVALLDWHKEHKKFDEERLAKEYAEKLGEIILRVAVLMNWTQEKAKKWTLRKNPFLGNVSPKHMVYLGRADKVLKFIEARESGD